LLKKRIKQKRAELKETKQKTIKLHFQNLVDYEKEIKWAEEEIEIWKADLKTEIFQCQDLDFKKRVMINLIKLNAFVEEVKKSLKKSQAIVSYFLIIGDITAGKVQEIMEYE